jgi:hypothetical protein
MAVAWSWAFDTPFKWTKQIASHFGGTRQGLVISWPNRIKDAGGVRSQFHHVIDIVPTILEATGVKAPQVVDGIKQKPIEGISMAYTFDKKNENMASKRKTQYFEMVSNRGIYHDGWYPNTTPPHGPWILNAPLPVPTAYKWELYNLKEDYSQANDLAARKYQVLPLDNRSFARAVEPRPSTTAGRTVFTYTGVNPGIPVANAPNILGKSYTITAEVDVPQGGGNGMLATIGGRWGGWGLYIVNGKPIFNYNMLILAPRTTNLHSWAPASFQRDFFAHRGRACGRVPYSPARRAKKPSSLCHGTRAGLPAPDGLAPLSCCLCSSCGPPC